MFEVSPPTFGTKNRSSVEIFPTFPVRGDFGPKNPPPRGRTLTQPCRLASPSQHLQPSPLSPCRPFTQQQKSTKFSTIKKSSWHGSFLRWFDILGVLNIPLENSHQTPQLLQYLSVWGRNLAEVCFGGNTSGVGLKVLKRIPHKEAAESTHGHYVDSKNFRMACKIIVQQDESGWVILIFQSKVHHDWISFPQKLAKVSKNLDGGKTRVPFGYKGLRGYVEFLGCTHTIPWKINMEPTNGGVERCFSIKTVMFRFQPFIFQGPTIPFLELLDGSFEGSEPPKQWIWTYERPGPSLCFEGTWTTKCMSEKEKNMWETKTLQNSILLIVIVGLFQMNTYNIMLNTINYMSVIYYAWLQNQSCNLFPYISGFVIITWNNPKKLEKPCITKG